MHHGDYGNRMFLGVLVTAYFRSIQIFSKMLGINVSV